VIASSIKATAQLKQQAVCKIHGESEADFWWHIGDIHGAIDVQNSATQEQPASTAKRN
jgi:hypothetical protein